VETPDSDWVRNGDDCEQEQQVNCAEPVVALGIDAARVMVLKPVSADDDVAEDKREMLAPLFGHGLGEIAVVLWTVGRAGDLDLNDQERERDSEDCVAEPFEAVEPALRAIGLSVAGFGHAQGNPRDDARLLRLKGLALPAENGKGR